MAPAAVTAAAAPRERRPPRRLADEAAPPGSKPERAGAGRGPARARAASAAAASDPPGARPAKPDQTAGSKRRRAASAAPAGAPKRPKRTGAAGGSDPEAAAEAAARKAEAAAQKQKQKQEAKELKRAAAKEQRELKAKAAQAQKAAAKAAKAVAVEEERQVRRVPPSAQAETASREAACELLGSLAVAFCAADPDDAAGRRALLGPLLADGPPPAAELLALCERWRAQLHTAYGNATELPVSQHAEANLTLRLEGMGPERRRELSTAWLALPGVVAGETGARARLSLSDMILDLVSRNLYEYEVVCIYIYTSLTLTTRGARDARSRSTALCGVCV